MAAGFLSAGFLAAGFFAAGFFAVGILLSSHVVIFYIYRREQYFNYISIYIFRKKFSHTWAPLPEKNDKIPETRGGDMAVPVSLFSE
ncbi:MAG: hypothetical protein LBQ57_02715 [Spirochaetales bacterium]|nr:hypothetical protein [Spirochaetales bacterium]